MVMRIQIVDGEYRVVVPLEAVEALNLSEGTPVRVVPVAEPSESRYVGVEEGMKAYFETEPFHRNSYRELAK
jgi:bifunctional DNA-binding transcriptional regulator/antitoxin component of YhaV-PrlF toxin-antitoxin module